jgi:HlyD family secretion protein
VRKITIAIILVALLAASYLCWHRSSREEPQITYVSIPVEKGTLKAEINSTGTVKPLVEVQVGSQVSGTIKKLYADFESRVKEGQLIALIDPDTYEAKAEQANANLQSTRANLEKAQVTLVDQLRTLRRKDELLKNHSISQSEYDTAQTNADAARAQVDVEMAAVAQMEANLKEAQLQIKYTRIVAPVTGTVTARSMDAGQTVTASFQTPVLFRIAEDLTRMQVYTSVDEADIGRVREGQEAVFTVPAFPDEYFRATVSQIRNDPQVQQNVVTYNVILDVANPELKLRPGMTTNVQIHLTEVRDALMVPDQAFRFSPKDVSPYSDQLTSPKSGQRRLWKLEGKDRLRPVNVGIGVVGAERVQIVSDEIKAADRIVVEAVQKKKEGQQAPALRLRF